jgi:hypothetical protein
VRFVRKFIAISLFATAAVLASVSAPAFASTLVSPSPNFTVLNDSDGYPVPQTYDTSGWTVGSTVFAEVCDGKSPSAPGYDVNSDCDSSTQVSGVVVQDAAGDAIFPAAPADHGNLSVPIFHGMGPNDLFNCLAAGDNPNGTETPIGTQTGDHGDTDNPDNPGAVLSIDPTAPSWGASTVGSAQGGTANCQIRIGTGATTSNPTDIYIPFVLSDTLPTGPGTTVPESPLAIALPIGAVVLLGTGGFVMTRKRRAARAA